MPPRTFATPTSGHPRRAAILLAGMALSASIAAQSGGAPYPGAEVPAAPVASDAASPSPAGDAPTSVTPFVTRSAGGPASTDVLAGSAGLDVRQLTETPFAALRDLDGDGHLDGLDLSAGLRVWAGLGDGTFEPPTIQPPTGDLPGRQADLNGDGRPDVVFAGSFQGVDVARAYLDQGDGTFAALPAVDLPVDVEPRWSLGDVDGDGLPDIVTTLDLHNQPTEVHALLATGVGSWSNDLLVGLLADQIPAGTALGDLDLDGDLDVLAGWSKGFFAPPVSGLRSFVQDGGGGFDQVADLVVESTLLELTVADLSGDGLPDLFARTRDAGQRYHQLWTGDGTGGLSALPLTVDDLGADLRFGDIDGDGRLDLLAQGDPIPTYPMVHLARPDGSLSPPIVVPHVARPTGWGDLDGDGLIDLFAPETLLPGRGDGRFDTPIGSTLLVDVQLQEELTVADLDGDGLLDVVASQGSPSTGNRLHIAYGRGVGRFAPAVELTTSPTVRTTAVGDLDGDGLKDLWLCYKAAPQGQLWLGRPDGTLVLGPPIDIGGTAQADIGVGHFNADARPDLVALSAEGLRVRRNDGLLSFSPVTTFPLALPLSATFGRALEVVDVDGDGLDDVLVRQPEVLLYRCLGHTQFAPAVQVAAAASHLTVADVDGDGHLDLLTSRVEDAGDVLAGGESLEVALGDGSGGFSPAPAWGADSDRSIWGTNVVDVDGDGRLDLIMGHRDSWSLHPGLAGGGFAHAPSLRFDVPEGAQRVVVDDLDGNGWPDVLTLSAGGLGLGEQPGQGPTAFLHRGGPWSDARHGLPGAAGIPALVGTGALAGADPVGLELRGGAPGAVSWLVLGFAELSAPLKGGVLVPDPLVILQAPTSDALGDLSVQTTWPAGVPSGVSLWAQVWQQDVAGPVGLAASHGLRGTTP